MTISTTENKQRWEGNGSTTAFSITSFKFFDADDITVYLINESTGAEEEQSSGYTITLTSSTDLPTTGTLTFDTAPADGFDVLAKRVQDYTQETSIPRNGDFNAQNIERRFDRHMMVMQQLKEEVDRAVLQPIGSELSSITLPTPENGKYLQWSGTDGTMVNTTVSATVDIDDAESLLLDEAADQTEAHTSYNTIVQGLAGTTTHTGNTMVADSTAGVFVSDGSNTQQGGWLYTHSGDSLGFWANGAERMALTDAGLTLADDDKITVDAAGVGATTLLEVKNSNGNILLFQTEASDANILIGQSGGDINIQNSSGTTQVKMFDTGRMDIGPNTQSSTNISQVNIESSSNLLRMYAKIDSAGGEVAWMYSDTGSAFTKHFAMQADGDLRNTNNSYASLSDRTIKSNIAESTAKLDDVMALSIKTYTNNRSKTKQIGVVADEIEQVFPSLVKTIKGGDDDGLKYVKYSVLLPILIKAFQEYVTQSNSRLDALESV